MHHSRFHFKRWSLPTALLVAVLALPNLTTAQETNKEDNKLTPVGLELVDGKAVAKLAPENTKVEFTGVHAEGEPRPRLGGFKKFTGALTVEDDKLLGINVEFEIGSIWTEFDKLTVHLMKADFFEASKFPKASFTSTKLTSQGEGKYTVSGELTLHGESSAIEFPAKFQRMEDGVTLTAEFVLDRTRFGMDKMTGGVKKKVDLKVVVGQATPNIESSDGNGGGSNDKQAARPTDEKMDGMTVTIQLPNMT